MTSNYEAGFAKNVFQQLDTQCSLYVLGFCLASHDIAWQRDFAVSLSILREVAKIVDHADNLTLTTRFSQETRSVFADLKKDLQPFQGNSLTRGTLKPIRDIAFHYDLTKADPKRIGPLLAKVKGEHELRVRANGGDDSILRYRYTFADEFRSKLVESYLTKDVVDQISAAAVNVIAFTDSLMADLSQ